MVTDMRKPTKSTVVSLIARAFLDLGQGLRAEEIAAHAQVDDDLVWSALKGRIDFSDRGDSGWFYTSTRSLEELCSQETPRSRLLAQLAMVFDAEARAAVPDPYDLPRVRPTTAQTRESARLTRIGNALFRRAEREGFGTGPDGAGSDAAFGYLAR